MTTYEIRIVAGNREKIIYFGSNFTDYEDTYHCAGYVIDGEPEQIEEGDCEIGRIETDLPFSEVARMMIEEAGLMGERATAALLEDAARSECL